jgi:hypothetical protein
MYPQLEQCQQERILQEVIISLAEDTVGRGNPNLLHAVASEGGPD